jgi:hypothetical protein
MGGSIEKGMYLVDYDLPAGNRRRQFYRYVDKILEGCCWTKSSNSVILVDNLVTAQAIAEVAKAFNACSANVYKVIPL